MHLLNKSYFIFISLYVFFVLNKVFIMKSLDPLRAKKTFIRKKLGHTIRL